MSQAVVDVTLSSTISLATAVRARPERPAGLGLRLPSHRLPRPPRLVRPVRAPVRTLVPPPAPTATPPASAPPAGASCENACSYAVGQLRMTWYDATGLRVSGFISPGLCAPLPTDAGVEGTIRMYDWLAQAGDTGLEHVTSFVVGSHGTGRATNGGTVALSEVGGRLSFTYTAPAPSLARASDGAAFPVVFQTCLTLGNQSVRWRLVCQPKSTGMLCHQ